MGHWCCHRKSKQILIRIGWVIGAANSHIQKKNVIFFNIPMQMILIDSQIFCILLRLNNINSENVFLLPPLHSIVL